MTPWGPHRYSGRATGCSSLHTGQAFFYIIHFWIPRDLKRFVNLTWLLITCRRMTLRVRESQAVSGVVVVKCNANIGQLSLLYLPWALVLSLLCPQVRRTGRPVNWASLWSPSRATCWRADQAPTQVTLLTPGHHSVIWGSFIFQNWAVFTLLQQSFCSVNSSFVSDASQSNCTKG